MKLSLILTVYNKEQYLSRMLDAALSQQEVRENDYEVVAVNDGSNDGSAVILNEYARHNKRLRIISQKNQGLSMARNNGINAALGEYVWCIDADDTISPLAVKYLIEAMHTLPDVITIHAETNGIDHVRNNIPAGTYTGKQLVLSGALEPCGVFYAMRLQFLKNNGLCFFPNIYHEDNEFTPRLYYAAKQVVVVPKVLYTVFRTEESITTTPNPKRVYDLITVAKSNYRLIDDNNEWNTCFGNWMSKRGAMALCSAMHLLRIIDDEEVQKRFNGELFECRYLIRMFLHSKTARYVLLGVLFKLVPCRYFQIYNFTKYFGGA